MRRMRWLFCGLAIIGLAPQAGAADMGDFLRGSSTVISQPSSGGWDGIYFGGQFGSNVAGTDFGQSTSSLTALLVRPGTPFATATASPLGTNDTTGYNFGGFVGYNTQWEGAVVGFEGNYNRYNTTMSATNLITGNWIAPDGILYPYTAAGTSSVRITDYGTLRLRGGWDAGRIMPYAMIGVAIGRGDITRTVVATVTPPTGSPPLAPVTLTENLSGQFAYGYAAGVGIDFCLLANLFVRAEYEYVQFGDFHSLNVHLHNVRLGAAIKF